MDTETTVFSIALLLFLLICSALISGAEVALFSLTKSEIDSFNDNNSKSKKTIAKLLNSPQKLLATILVANNFINIGIVILFASISEKLFGNWTINVSLFFFDLNIDLVFFIEVFLITFLILLFGEILPKIYANRNNLNFSKFMARPLKILDIIFSPISIPLKNTSLTIHKLLGKQKSNFNINHISQALELTSKVNTSKEEQKILKGIVSFGNTETRQAMRPRIDIFAIEISTNFNTVISKIVENGYSRIPVFDNNIDSIKGILYAKDLLPHLRKKSFDWIRLIRQPFFVPENKKLDDLMTEFQKKKVHLAIVVDEYGGTSGVISLEDIIEEIVGDISDEFDDDDIVYSKIDDFNYVFEGKTSLKDFYRIIKIEDESIFENKKGESETIAGFVLEISKSFPKLKTQYKFNNYTFIVEGINNKRIKQIKVSISR